MTSTASGESDALHSPAVEYITQNRGFQFDPQIVDSFLNIQPEFEQIRQAHPIDTADKQQVN